MPEILLVVKREFLERVRTKSFLIGTFLVPLFFIGIYSVPFFVSSERSERALVVVDEAPAGIAAQVVANLTAPRPSPDANTYRVETTDRPFDEIREVLTQRVLDKEIDGFVLLPAGILEGSPVVYRARNVANIEVLRDIDVAASRSVQAERLNRAGLDGAEVAALVRGVTMNTARITERGEEGGSAISTLITAYVVVLLIYMLVFFYGVTVMRSVLEEKTNRIAEVIVSSMKSTHLMVGKIVGVGAVALLQVGIWAAFVILIATQSRMIADRMGIPPEALDGFQFDLGILAPLLAFFIVGFFLYAALFAALGAAVGTEQEAQSLQMIILVPLILPMLLLVPITSEPLGRIATTLSMIPLTSPVVMPMRMSITGLPLAEVLGSLAILVASVAAVAWLAGKIYRVGILSTGKKPTLRELGRWLRTT
jgi:ABC-2 type transport system permease protein